MKKGPLMTDTPKNKSKIQVGSSEDIENPSIWKTIHSALERALTPDDLEKSDGNSIGNPDAHKDRPKRVRASFSSDLADHAESLHSDTYDRPLRRLRDKDLLELVRIDPHIGAIVNTRVAQVTSFGDRSESMFDKGVRLLDTKPPQEDEFNSKEEYTRECDRRAVLKDRILQWVLSCGTNDKDILSEIYIDSDKTFKSCTLKMYLQSQARALLSVGRCATQMIRDTQGELLIFRPAPVESIKPVRPGRRVYLTQSRGAEQEPSNNESLHAADAFNRIPDAEKPVAWVQELNGRQEAFFTEQDLRVSYYQVQAELDLCGYPLSPIEFALFLVYIHQHSLSYLRNQFSKGMLTRSIVCIRTTDPEAELAEEDLNKLKRELQNMAARTENSSVVPMISGPIDITIKPFDLGPKDLEWLNLEQTVIRALCSAYQISPSEVGFGLLGDPAGLSSDGSKDMELIQGEERGLRILVDILMEDLNQCIYDRFPEAERDGFKLIAVGLGNETRMAMLQRLSAEQNLVATINDLMSQSEKHDTIEYGGNVPLNPLFHSSVVRYMHYGKFLEVFFGQEGASQRPEYDFLIDPALNQSYQQLKTGGREVAIAQSQATIMQTQMMQMQAKAQAQAPQEQAQQESQTPKGNQDQTLEKRYNDHEELHKSLLDAWMDL
jgi:hypothetical protein